MYSNKENVNILTALLIARGVTKAVVCPGSRNSPIVHNLYEAPEITCFPVTDERSAGFYALGMCECGDEPVVVCVTSGTALLDVAPAVAEAYYQHKQLIVISADRPAQWIDQLDGQTMRQSNALAPFVRKSVTLNEPVTSEEQWYCNRLVNEALMELSHHGKGPVHINVPITEPLYEYNVETLPVERNMEIAECSADAEIVNSVADRFLESARPVLIIGQEDIGTFRGLTDEISKISGKTVVLYEKLGLDTWNVCHFDEVLAKAEKADLAPDFILYIGNTIVSKRLKEFLRTATDAKTWTVRSDNEVYDTFMNLEKAVECSPVEVVKAIADRIANNAACAVSTGYVDKWKELLASADRHGEEFQPEYSEMATVKYFEEQLEDMEYDFCVHYANSSAVRLANIYAGHYVYCNRGVNGIDGSISTAGGMSVATSDVVFCVTGDLSFFYDQNALWNKNIKGNLRIIVLNNGGGGIFQKFDGLKGSQACDSVMAKHETSVQGICTQNDCGYIKATTMDEMQLGVVQLLTMETSRPVVLEVFTDAVEDARVLKNYYK